MLSVVVKANGGNIGKFYQLNEVFGELLEEIKTSIKYTNTPLDAVHLTARNFKMEPSLARMLFDILSDKVIYNALKEDQAQ